MKIKNFMKTLWKKIKLLKISNFTFFHNVFYAICILKSFSHISAVVCSFFEFGMISIWCTRERVKFDTFADSKKKYEICMWNGRKIVGKRQNAGFQYSLFPTMFSNVFFQWDIKVQYCVMNSLNEAIHTVNLVYRRYLGTL